MAYKIDQYILKNCLDFQPKIIKSNLKKAAVMCLLIYKENQFRVVLTKRSEYLNNHAGQISFPGGKIEKFDKTPLDAALRETYEEVGVKATDVEIIGKLDEIITGTKFHISPFVGIIVNNCNFKLNLEEVSELIFLPTNILLNKSNHSHVDKKFDNIKYNFRQIKYLNHFIWGATATILNGFAKRVWSYQKKNIRI